MADFAAAAVPWVATALVLAGFLLAYRRATGSWRLWRLAVGRDGRYSTSLFQGLAWTVVVLASYLAIWFARLHLGATGAIGPVPESVLAAMGLSLGTTAAAAGITSRRVRSRSEQRDPADADDLALRQLVCDDSGRPNLAKAQLMAWTVVALGIYAVTAVATVVRTAGAASLDGLPPLPDIEPTLLILMGIGQGAYLAVKAASAPEVAIGADATGGPTAASPLATALAAVEPVVSDGHPLLAAAAKPGSAAVPGFLPSRNGLHFINAWPHEPDVTIKLPGGGTLPIGDASNGVCGGMVYTVRDVFQTPGLAPVARTDNPLPGSALYRYIVKRLLESFDVGHLGVGRYLEWMLTPDGDAALGPALVRRGVAWKTVVEEWAGRIRPEIDAGRLVCLGLITVAGADPRQLGANHQVMAYGYDVGADGTLTVHVYDPNTPPAQADTVTISLSVLHPERATPITHNVAISHPIRGFFHTSYTYQDPRSQLD